MFPSYYIIALIYFIVFSLIFSGIGCLIGVGMISSVIIGWMLAIVIASLFWANGNYASTVGCGCSKK